MNRYLQAIEGERDYSDLSRPPHREKPQRRDELKQSIADFVPHGSNRVRCWHNAR
jgi:hypothetical protein